MLLNEIINPQSITEWFASNVVSVYAKACEQANNTFAETGTYKIAARMAGSILGRWYSANVINPSQYDIQSVVSSLNLPSDTIPQMIGIKSDRESMRYSASSNLTSVVLAVSDSLKQRGKKELAQKLSRAVDEYRSTLTKIRNQQKEEKDDNADVQLKQPKKSFADQKAVANALVMDVISKLPDSIRHSVRTEVARRGNTIQALQQVLNDKGIKY